MRVPPHPTAVESSGSPRPPWGRRLLTPYSQLSTAVEGGGILQAHDYLRLSVTDRCNLRCTYCMPPEGIPLLPRKGILTFEEMERIVRLLAQAGVAKVKITGGEPLVRGGIVQLVKAIAAIPQVEDLAMTTNGVLLARYARRLKEAGLQRVNVSLDSLSPEKFQRLTRLGKIEHVLEGIESALTERLTPVKLNVVLIEGFNEEEIPFFLRFAQQKGVSLKFIEEMPTTTNIGLRSFRAGLAPLVLERMAELGAVSPLESTWPGPARYFRVSALEQPVGIVSAISAAFCSSCTRLRLTAEGRLRPCLYSDHSVDLRSALRNGASDQEILSLVACAIGAAQKEGSVVEKVARCATAPTMFEVGG